MVDNWAILEGALLPAVIAMIIRHGAHWPDEMKAMMAFGVCILASIMTVYVTGQLDFSQPIDANRLIADILLVMAVAYATYKQFWQPTGIGPWIERKTG